MTTLLYSVETTKLELDKIMFVVLRGSLVVHQCSTNYSLSMTLDKCIERLECLPCCMLVYENHCIWSQAVDVIWSLFMFGRAVGLIWLSATYSPDKWTIDPWITPGSMTSLFAHKVAQPTKWRFLPKNLSQLVIFVIGLAFTWV